MGRLAGGAEGNPGSVGYLMLFPPFFKGGSGGICPNSLIISQNHPLITGELFMTLNYGVTLKIFRIIYEMQWAG